MEEMNDYAKVRKWQVQFEVHRPFATLPLPDIVVEEERSSPLYRLDGRLRGDSGGQLSITLGRPRRHPHRRSRSPADARAGRSCTTTATATSAITIRRTEPKCGTFSGWLSTATM